VPRKLAGEKQTIDILMADIRAYVHKNNSSRHKVDDYTESHLLKLMSVKRGTQLNTESDTDLSEDDRISKIVRYNSVSQFDVSVKGIGPLTNLA